VGTPDPGPAGRGAAGSPPPSARRGRRVGEGASPNPGCLEQGVSPISGLLESVVGEREGLGIQSWGGGRSIAPAFAAWGWMPSPTACGEQGSAPHGLGRPAGDPLHGEASSTTWRASRSCEPGVLPTPGLVNKGKKLENRLCVRINDQEEIIPQPECEQGEGEESEGSEILNRDGLSPWAEIPVVVLTITGEPRDRRNDWGCGETGRRGQVPHLRVKCRF